MNTFSIVICVYDVILTYYENIDRGGAEVNVFLLNKSISHHIGRVYAVTRVGTLVTRVARKRRGLAPEC